MLFYFMGLGFLKLVFIVIGGTYSAKYLWKECYRYFKGEEKTLPWPFAVLLGLFVGVPLIIGAICLFVFLQIEKKKDSAKKQVESESKES